MWTKYKACRPFGVAKASFDCIIMNPFGSLCIRHNVRAPGKIYSSSLKIHFLINKQFVEPFLAHPGSSNLISNNLRINYCKSPLITGRKNKYCPARSDSPWKLLDCKGSMIVLGEYRHPRQITVRKTVNTRQLLAQRSSTVRKDVLYAHHRLKIFFFLYKIEYFDDIQHCFNQARQGPT